MRLLCLLLLFNVSGYEAINYKPNYKPNLLEVAQGLNLTTFLEAVTKCGLHKIINHESFFTVFAPTNEAFANEKVYPGEDTLCDKVKLHIGRGQVKSSEFANELTFKSLLSKRTVRINVYPNKVVTANGRKVGDVDHEARNGVLHIISDVMSSVYARAGSVVSEMDECCPQHSELLELVKLSGLFGTLDQKGPFTLLAPNNGAFAKLHPDFINHLKKNRTALVNLLSAHVLPGTIYTPGLEDGMTIKTLAGSKIDVSTQNGVLKFGKASVTLADITAGNGAVHAVDEVLFPEFGLLQSHANSELSMNLVQLLEDKGYVSFASALKQTRLDRVIDHEGHFTVFAPTDQAFDNPRAYPQDTTLVERVSYYIARGLIKESMADDELLVPSLLSKRKLRFNLYENGKESIKTLNGQRITFHGYEAHNGIVHELEGGLDFVPPRQGNLHQILANLPQFSEFVELFDRFYPGLLEHPTSFVMTLFVPTNKVIDMVKQTGFNDQELAQFLLLNHIIPTSWYTNGLELKSSLTTLGGKVLHFKAEWEGAEENAKAKVFYANNAKLELPDFTAENGVFHQVDGLIL